MQDDLKERLQLIAELSGRLTSSEVASIAKQAADRIAALEAKLAEKDALLRECGEAAGRLNDQVAHVLLGKACRADISAALDELQTLSLALITTLAKIKDATDA